MTPTRRAAVTAGVLFLIGTAAGVLSIVEGPQRRNSRNSCLRQGFGEARRSAPREGGLLDEPGQSFSVAQTRRQRAERLDVIADHLIQHTLRGGGSSVGR